MISIDRITRKKKFLGRVLQLQRTSRASQSEQETLPSDARSVNFISLMAL